MTLTVHKFIQDGGQCRRSVRVGVDFETMLDIFKGDEVTEEQFSPLLILMSVTDSY